MTILNGLIEKLRGNLETVGNLGMVFQGQTTKS